MNIKDCMTRHVRTVSPDETLADAARAMADSDIGILPVAQGDRLVGMISDRDIAIRGVGRGKGPDTQVRDIMTSEVLYCFEDDDIEEVLENMGEMQVRRLPVLNPEKRLVGIVSLSDLADGSEEPAGEALCLIARQGGMHTQSLQSGGLQP
jgi:CBS domain-containing protein